MAKLFKPKIPVEMMRGKTVRQIPKRKGQSKTGTRARARYNLKRAKYLP